MNRGHGKPSRPICLPRGWWGEPASLDPLAVLVRRRDVYRDPAGGRTDRPVYLRSATLAAHLAIQYFPRKSCPEPAFVPRLTCQARIPTPAAKPLTCPTLVSSPILEFDTRRFTRDPKGHR